MRHLCVSFVTWAELLKGARRNARKTEVLRRLNALARRIPVRYPADQPSAGITRNRPPPQEAGTPIGADDLWIACHALAEDIPWSPTTREFRRIAGLHVEDWVSPKKTEKGHPRNSRRP